MKQDIQQKITNQIIKAIEQGTVPWRKTWAAGAGGFPLRSCGEAYKGINVLALWCAAQDKGYASDYWFTFKQSVALGAMVRKGERGACVVYYNKTICEDKATGEEKAISFLKSYSVFNADQIDGLPEEFTTERPDRGTRPVEELEAFFAATGADIRTTGQQPRYVHGSDHIEMPPISTFETPESYYSVLCHEEIHNAALRIMPR